MGGVAGNAQTETGPWELYPNHVTTIISTRSNFFWFFLILPVSKHADDDNPGAKR